MSGEQKDDLHGRWLHSHEEDTADARVYRLAGFAFPPSRGRSGFELGPDGTCSRIGIAARDGSSEQSCTWELVEDAESKLVLRFPGGEPLVMRIVSVAKDRLVIRR